MAERRTELSEDKGIGRSRTRTFVSSEPPGASLSPEGRKGKTGVTVGVTQSAADLERRQDQHLSLSLRVPRPHH